MRKQIIIGIIIALLLVLSSYIVAAPIWFGSGTNRIIEECLKKGLPSPIFEETAGNLLVTFRKYKIEQEEIEKLKERQKNAIEYLKQHKKITNKEYRTLNPHITDRTALSDLRDLVNKGVLKAEGDKKQRYYTLQ